MPKILFPRHQVTSANLLVDSNLEEKCFCYKTDQGWLRSGTTRVQRADEMGGNFYMWLILPSIVYFGCDEDERK